jgi:PAP2 superfamily.
MTLFSLFGRCDVIMIIFSTLLFFKRYRTKAYLFTTLGLAAMTPLSNNLIKLLLNRPRPLSVYPAESVHTVPWLENAYHFSFPSGHTFGAFGLCLLLSYLLPNDRKQYAWLFFLLAIGCGISRIYLGQHFFVDVWAGSLLGTLVALAIMIIVEIFIVEKRLED